MPLFYSSSVEGLAKTQFTRLGHPGRYTSVVAHTGGELFLTGALYGHGAMMIGSGTFPAALDKAEDNAHIELSDGGQIKLGDLMNTQVGDSSIMDLSVMYITSSAVGDRANIYFFKRQM